MYRRDSHHTAIVPQDSYMMLFIQVLRHLLAAEKHCVKTTFCFTSRQVSDEEEIAPGHDFFGNPVSMVARQDEASQQVCLLTSRCL